MEEVKGELMGLSLLTDQDTNRFNSGKAYEIYNKMGSHLAVHEGKEGVSFAVWAPNASEVSVIGEFNHWDKKANMLSPRWDSSGIWEGFIPGVKKGDLYKYAIRNDFHNINLEKSDPFAKFCQTPPATASVVWDLDYQWQDNDWMENRHRKGLNEAISVYEMHFDSWRRVVEDDDRPMTYREMGEQLPSYLDEMGFTHVEFLPLMEFPYGGSWGYQLTGYFAPTSRYGTPEDFMYMIDCLHRKNIGVIMDWVPSNFPMDAHGLHRFDGSYLFEHEDPRQGFHPDWKTSIYNLGRPEVKNFLISNALFWLEKYHIDGLRVDAVASMLYLDYSREEGQWISNKYGGNQNLEAIAFFQECNSVIKERFPKVFLIAEESTAWDGVTRSVNEGGLGFDMKWMMGWMHDTLNYLKREPIYRSFHQNDITFSMTYTFSEKFMLPLSHDEVVHGKSSLLGRMPGDEWERFANLRLLYAYMFCHPGSKLLFMGAEIGQMNEWNFKKSLDWHLLREEKNQGIQHLVKDLNELYQKEKALHQLQFEEQGFEWIDGSDVKNSVMVFLRKGKKAELLIIINFKPVYLENYGLGVPKSGTYHEIFNSDKTCYGGSGRENSLIKSKKIPLHNRENSIQLNLSPLSLSILKRKA